MIRGLVLSALCACVGFVAADETKVSQRWAVLVGVDDYAYANDLDFCGADQFSLFEQLKKSGFPEENVFILHTKANDARYQPSRSNIERQLNLVFQLAEEKDLLIVGFSGHGIHIDGKSYLCPADAELEDPKTLISLDDVYDRLNACAAPFKLVVVDACRNDPRPGGKRSFEANAGTRALADSLHALELPKGVVLLNSCAPGEISWEEREFGHGVFMHYVLDGLSGGADSSGDGSVSLNELGEYVGPKTKAYVARKFGYPQRPFFKGELSIEAMSYALLPVPAGRAARPATATSSASTSPSGSSGASRGDPRDTRFPPRSEVRPGEGWLGVSTMRPLYRHNVVIGALADSAAAGLQRGDKILAVDDHAVTRRGELDEALRARNAGDTIQLKLERNGKEIVAAVTLDSMPPDAGNGRMLAAAEAGETFAMVEMAQRYGGLVPDLVPLCETNQPEALRWARRAAEAGDVIGRLEMGLLLAHGKLVRNEAEAAQIFQSVLTELEEKNLVEFAAWVRHNLSTLHVEGRGVQRDAAKGVKYLRDAIEAGHLGSVMRMGYLYENGLGLPRDYGKAMELYLLAAEQGYNEAETNIGHLCEYGLGVRADLQTAIEWYRIAASHGEPQAMFNLGLFHEFGRGVSQNYATAAEWYRKAAARGHEEAKQKLR